MNIDFASNYQHFPQTERVLREYAERVVAAYRENMRVNRHTTMSPATLIDNVEAEVLNNTAGVLSVNLRLADYWKYVEYDTRPHWAPISPLIEWAKRKAGIPTPSKEFPTPASFAYAVRAKIAREGTKGTHDLERAVDAMNARYLPMIRDAISADIGAMTQAQIWLLAGTGQ